MKTILAQIALYGLAIVTVPGLAGIKITGEILQSAKKLPLSVFLDGAKVRMDTESPEDPTQRHRLIYDSAAENLAYLDDKQKRLLQMPVAQLEMIATIAAKLQQKGGMKIQAPVYPPKQIPQEHAFTFRSTGTSRKVGKWTCSVHELLKNKKKLGEVCTAPLSETGLSAQDLVPLEKLSKALRPLVAAAPGGAPDYPDYLFSRMNEMGITVHAHAEDPLTKKAHDFLLTGVERVTMTAAVFAVPSDYKVMAPTFRK